MSCSDLATPITLKVVVGLYLRLFYKIIGKECLQVLGEGLIPLP